MCFNLGIIVALQSKC